MAKKQAPITYPVPDGADIDDVAYAMLDLARIKGRPIRATYNGVPLQAVRTDTIGSIMDAYNAAREAHEEQGQLRVPCTDAMRTALTDLQRTGLYGDTMEAAAAELLRRAIREEILIGLCHRRP